jgi:predicted XRE-type DNA-binding protein
MLIKKRSSASEQVSTISVPDAARLKAELVRQMAIIIEEKSLTRKVVAELLGFNQPQVSMMLRGQVKSYGVEQLADFLNILHGRSPQNRPTQIQNAASTSEPQGIQDTSSDQISSQAKNADEVELKAALVQQIVEDISRQGMSQRSVGELLGFSQPQVSLMLRGRTRAYSIDQLSGYLDTLRGQNLAVSVPAQAATKPHTAAPSIAVDDDWDAGPDEQSEMAESVAGMMEEIAYLRQHLALVSRSDSPQERLHQRWVMQAEVELLRSENLILQEKTARFDRMTALLQLA